MLISVIIPAFNAEMHIENCVRSIQTSYFNIEVIVVNDGSTDRTLEICNKLASENPNIKIFTIKNSGAYTARQYGVRKADGDYITFIDADDTFVDGGIELLVKEIDNDSEVIITEAKDDKLCSTKSYCEDIFTGSIRGSLCGNIYKKGIINQALVPINRRITMGEDLIQNLFVSLYATKIRYTQLNIYNYNYNLASVTKTFKRTFEYEQLFYQTIYDKFLSNPKCSFSDDIEFHVCKSFLNGCKRTVLAGERIYYNSEIWNRMVKILDEKRDDLTTDEIITYRIHNHFVARLFITLYYKKETIKRHFRIKRHPNK